ncbi:hypothetical protein ABZ639_08390 [Saccharomonospora sp. NPDC006951]
MTAGGEPLEDPRWEWVRAAALAPVATPRGLVDRVLFSVRGRSGRGIADPVLLRQDGGTLHVGERAVVALALRAARAAAARIGGIGVSAAAMAGDGVDLLVTVHYGTRAAEAARRLRVDVTAALTAQFGTAAPPVSVHITDLRPGS